jgi:hypothetical protein
MPKTDKLASLESMSSHIGKMFEEGSFSDVVTNIGQTKKSLHKNVLSYRSEFFRAMFEHSFTESSNPVVNIEVAEGSTAEATVCVVEYLYTGWIDLTPETGGRNHGGCRQIARVWSFDSMWRLFGRLSKHRERMRNP